VAARGSARASVAEGEALLDARLAGLGIWLALAADTFFFAAWWFSFFYLRAMNNNQSWTAQGVGPPSRGFGLIVLGLVILTAVCYWLTSRLLYGSFLFSLLAPISLVLGIAACLFQGYGMWHFGFGLTQGGYPSVFAGLTGSWLVQLVLAVGWLATIVAQARPAGDTVLRPYAAASFGWVLLYLAGIGVINFILLYLVH
jgi:heme/copper-type cytochrome/quinol oxidase subunit 3